MAPHGESTYYYGDGVECRVAPHAPQALDVSLDPVRVAFDENIDVPRVVALMPHMGCDRGAAILRQEVLDRYPGANLRLIVIWQDVARNGDSRAAHRAAEALADERVTTFFDCQGLAGRAFARGNLPIAEARELFLFYPAGLRWPTADGAQAQTVGRPLCGSETPSTETWVHQLGRVAPERFCDPEELPLAIRATLARLLDDARKRAKALGIDGVPSDPRADQGSHQIAHGSR